MKKSGIRPGIVAGGAAVGAAAVYIAGSLFFGSRFLPNTTVNGVKASGATVDTVKERIQDQAADYSLTLKEADDKTEVITQKDVGLAIDTEDGQIEAFLNSRSGWGWVGALFSPTEYTSNNIVSYDKAKLKKTIDNLDCIVNMNDVITEDAKAVYEGGSYVGVSEIYGTNINKKSFTKKLGKALLNLDESVDMVADKYYVQPKVTADSKEFEDLLDEMNEIINTQVSYQVGSSTENVDKDTIATWIRSDDSKTVVFDRDAMMAFLDEMGRKYNTFGLPKQLKTSSGGTVTVPGGSYGWRIDKEGELAELQRQLLAHEPVNRDFVYQYTANSHDGPDYGNSYVEVNITAQHVYVYKDGALVVDTACVTGNPTKGNGTHTGAFQLTYKERDATLKGDNYSSDVSYWMPFNGNEGLHDAPWRSSFGGSIYKSNGSHGCVNLPVSAAARIFPVVDKGFPVLVYTMGGTESEQISEEDSSDKSTEVSEEKSSQELASAVVEKINKIGPVTAESGPAIKDARSSYDALSDEAKSLVSNAQTLSDAEATFSQISTVTEEAPSQEAQPAADPAQLQASADQVAAAISAIGPVTSDSGSAIAAAEAAYGALPDEAKALVPNAGELSAKRAEYDSLGVE